MEKLPNSYYNIPHIEIDQYELGEEIKVISKQFAKQHKVIPIEICGNMLIVCMASPSEKLWDKIQKQTGKIVRVVKSHEHKIEEVLKMAY